MITNHTNHIKFVRKNDFFSIIIDDYELFDFIDDLLTEGIEENVVNCVEFAFSENILHCHPIFEDKILAVITSVDPSEIERIFLLNNSYKNLPNKNDAPESASPPR